ncbi:MAG: XRE family transcriptional regulator [Bordetella sp.]|nr:XRE family transcriptional regulator [Bordetella sp.]
MPAAPAAPPAADILADRKSLGMRLRALRKAGALTLRELSDRTGVALSTLSKMELGQVSISYEKFAAVARALEVDIGQLFGPAPRGAGTPGPLRSTLADAPGYHTGPYDYKLLAAQYPARSMTPMYGRILARDAAEFDGFVRHAGQEFLMVLAGEVEIRYETGESLILARNETAYFDSGVGHLYLSRSAAPAEVLVVMSDAGVAEHRLGGDGADLQAALDRAQPARRPASRRGR